MAGGRTRRWSGAQSGGEVDGDLRLRTAKWAWRCSSLSSRPWWAMGRRLLLCCVADILVGYCCGECQSIRVKSLVHVDVASRSTMRALASLVCWARRRSMWWTPSVALTAQQGGHTRVTGRWVIVTGSTSLLIYTAAGDWAWVRWCRSSMKLLWEAASPHCPVVCSV